MNIVIKQKTVTFFCRSYRLSLLRTSTLYFQRARSFVVTYAYKKMRTLMYRAVTLFIHLTAVRVETISTPLIFLPITSHTRVLLLPHTQVIKIVRSRTLRQPLRKNIILPILGFCWRMAGLIFAFSIPSTVLKLYSKSLNSQADISFAVFCVSNSKYCFPPTIR